MTLGKVITSLHSRLSTYNILYLIISCPQGMGETELMEHLQRLPGTDGTGDSSLLAVCGWQQWSEFEY